MRAIEVVRIPVGRVAEWNDDRRSKDSPRPATHTVRAAVVIYDAGSGLRRSQGRGACLTDEKVAGRQGLRCRLCYRQGQVRRLIDPDQMGAAMAGMIVVMVVLVGKGCRVGYIDEAFRLRGIHGMRIECPGGRKTHQAQHDRGSNGFSETQHRLACNSWLCDRNSKPRIG